MTYKIAPIHCPYCPAHTATYTTFGDLEAHRLDRHERPLPLAVCAARLAFEEGFIGRPRVGAWAPELASPTARDWSLAWQKAQQEERTPHAGSDNAVTRE